MAGKRKSGRTYAGQYTVESIDFWWNDPRIRKTSATIKVFLWYANQAAVKERRETLPKWYSSRIIGDLCDLDPKTSEKCLRCLKEKSLLGETDEGCIIVYGVKSRHPNLKWKDGDICDRMQVQMNDQAVSDKRLRGETRARGAVSRVPDVPPENWMDRELKKHREAKQSSVSRA